jgi:hypothetical protein
MAHAVFYAPLLFVDINDAFSGIKEADEDETERYVRSRVWYTTETGRPGDLPGANL